MTISYCNAIHSIKMEGRSGALHPARILIVVRTALTLVLIYSDSSPWCRHSIKMEGRSGALHPARILVVVQTALTLVFTYSDSLGLRLWVSS